ncbi:MAG: 50S ribosomal protein L23 [Candidatus Iainarchaeum archaeon]|uniref:Large ribosomal subunit protein uL23 n=1 Tax=Candidatus Iainarchaeum sp. TaxID=3101447 RepID=A0A497JII0_9ARCH|nr:MAG: 50S ribosomal protein L23 [Candidatus Diapherotrites archaeon]
MNALKIIRYPLITEKAVDMIEKQNKITFIVDKNANKAEIKTAIETLYNVKIDAVNTIRDMQGRKKAIVKLNKKFKASDLAMRLGII